MSTKYDFSAIEKKWQKIWDENHTFKASEDYSKPKFYALVEFPYPSGQGLHIGHPRPYTAMDVVSRKRRLEGYNVLFPMGWDAFGLPTENYAIKNHIHPAIVTERNVKHFKEQLMPSCSAISKKTCAVRRHRSGRTGTTWFFPSARRICGNTAPRGSSGRPSWP